MGKSRPKHNLQNELKIIELAKKNPSRFAPLYNIYYRQIFIFIYKKVQDEMLTEDLSAKVFMKALINIKKYEYRGFPFSSWLYRIASNEVNMHFRAAKKMTTVQIMESDVITLMEEMKEPGDIDRQELVISCLAELNAETVQLIELRFFDKLSFKDIGVVIGVTEGNAKIRCYRALDKLKKIVSEKLK